jgi:hypothetical protein
VLRSIYRDEELSVSLCVFVRRFKQAGLVSSHNRDRGSLFWARRSRTMQ